MTDKLVLSQSRAKLRRQCARAHYYRYITGLDKKATSRPLAFGRLIHLLIETNANGDDPFEKLDEVEAQFGRQYEIYREDYGDILNDTRIILTEYLEHWNHDEGLVYIRKNKRSAEHPFELELEKDVFIKGKIDAVAGARGLRWLVEHKSFGNHLPTDEERWRNLQAALYLRVCDITGQFGKVSGLMWDYVLSKAPPGLKILQSGELSTAKGNTTLPTKLKEWCKENGLTVSREIMDRCMDQRDKYFIRVFNPISKGVVDELVADFVATYRLIQHDPEAKERSIGRHCSWCSFESLCRAELQDSDTEFIIKTQYQARGNGDDLF